MSRYTKAQISEIFSMFEEGRALGLSLPADTPSARGYFGLTGMPGIFDDSGVVSLASPPRGTYTFSVVYSGTPDLKGALYDVIGEFAEPFNPEITEKIPYLDVVHHSVQVEKFAKMLDYATKVNKTVADAVGEVRGILNHERMEKTRLEKEHLEKELEDLGITVMVWTPRTASK